MFKRKLIAGEPLKPGDLVTKRKKWYQWHYRAYRVRHASEVPIGIEGFGADVVVKGRVIIREPW